MNFKNLALLTAVAATLVACGGGGGDTPAATTTPIAAGPADKYVGAWSFCQVATAPRTDGLLSASSDLVITKTGPALLSLSINAFAFAAPNCSGTAVNQANGIAAVTLNGTKLIGTDTVDRWDIVGTSQAPDLNGPGKDIGFVSGNTLKFGGEALDAEGYPVALYDLGVFTKR